jgi:plastocyanin
MTRTRIAILGVVTILCIGAVATGVFALANNSLGKPKEQAKATCQGDHNEYTVTVQNDKLSLNDIHAKLCDKLTIVNADDTLRLMAFGVHDHHQAYDGIEEKALKKDAQLSVTLDQTGTFTFHDHLHDGVEGTFTVE